MDQLSSCYFCGGALDTSLSEYPVVPADLRASDEDSLTVVLCPTCRRKLGRVVEEVVAATEAGNVSAEDEDGYDDTGFEPIDEANERPGTLLDDSDDPPSEESETETTASAEQPAAAGSTTSKGNTHEGTNGDTHGDAEAAEASGATSDDDPELTRLEYNKVMRLLQNRQLPVDRAEIRDVAISAYGIDPEEFDAVIKAAVERGLIAESNGQFVDPDGQG
jgi:hypothetical protein